METTNIIRFLHLSSLFSLSFTYFDEIFCPYPVTRLYIVQALSWDGSEGDEATINQSAFYVVNGQVFLIFNCYCQTIQLFYPPFFLSSAFYCHWLCLQILCWEEEMKMGVVVITRSFQLQMVLDSRDHDCGTHNNQELTDQMRDSYMK